jgi:competence protein ComFC
MIRFFRNPGRMVQPFVRATRSFFLMTADFIYPPSCLVCRNSLSNQAVLICRSCWGSFPLLSDPFLLITPVTLALPPPHFFHSSMALYRYSEEIQRLIHLFKYRGFWRMGDEFGRRLGQLYGSMTAHPVVDALVPVPLHRVRLRERGYNQSQILAAAISKESGIPLWHDVLRRDRYTKSQVKMTHDERIKNVFNAFQVRDGDRIDGSRILLVDDVFTTGSTLNECARTLRLAGAEQVDCISIVRV